MSKRVLCLIMDGVEELELVAPVDLLRRAGVEVVMVAVGSELWVTGRNGIRLSADSTLEEVIEMYEGHFDSWDALLLPGGPGVQALREDGRAGAIARIFDDDKGWVAAICAAPRILVDAGLLAKRQATAHQGVWEHIPNLVKDKAVVVDDRVMTSMGAGTSIDFGMALVRELMGKEVAEKVAEGTMDAFRGCV